MADLSGWADGGEKIGVMARSAREDEDTRQPVSSVWERCVWGSTVRRLGVVRGDTKAELE